MSLKDFRTSSKVANQGTWINVGTNADGTKCRFLLSRLGNQNTRYQKALEKALRENRKNDDVEKGKEAYTRVFCETIILGWEHLQPNDAGAKDEVAFSPDAAFKLLNDPDWTDLYNHLSNEAADAANFRQAQVEADAKN